MKTKLKYDSFKNYLVKEINRSENEETLKISKILGTESFNYQWIFRFKNGYGASVIKHYGSYGFEDDLFELGVIKFDEDERYSLTYNTPITEDVIGYLTNDDVLYYLEEISKL